MALAPKRREGEQGVHSLPLEGSPSEQGGGPCPPSSSAPAATPGSLRQATQWWVGPWDRTASPGCWMSFFWGEGVQQSRLSSPAWGEVQSPDAGLGGVGGIASQAFGGMRRAAGWAPEPGIFSGSCIPGRLASWALGSPAGGWGWGLWGRGAPLASCQGSWDPWSVWVVGAPTEFSVWTRPGRGRCHSWAGCPDLGEAGVRAGQWPVASGCSRRGGLSRTPVLQSQPSPGSWSGGWQWGCYRQISCLCVFATPFYKGKHNLKYDYLVL